MAVADGEKHGHPILKEIAVAGKRAVRVDGKSVVVCSDECVRGGGRPGEVRVVIARLWHGWTSRDNADACEQLLRTTILPGIRRVPGYQGAHLLRRDRRRSS